jgi:hypothetical protein
MRSPSIVASLYSVCQQGRRCLWGFGLALAMSFDDGQHIAADDGRVSVVCSMVGFFGNKFVVELCPRDSTGQSISGLIQEGHIQIPQIPHSSREFVTTKNIDDRSGMSNT